MLLPCHLFHPPYSNSECVAHCQPLLCGWDKTTKIIIRCYLYFIYSSPASFRTLCYLLSITLWSLTILHILLLLILKTHTHDVYLFLQMSIHFTRNLHSIVNTKGVDSQIYNQKFLQHAISTTPSIWFYSISSLSSIGNPGEINDLCHPKMEHNRSILRCNKD
jgi:hypothetical protein